MRVLRGVGEVVCEVEERVVVTLARSASKGAGEIAGLRKGESGTLAMVEYTHRRVAFNVMPEVVQNEDRGRGGVV